jgi:hypothetical protein
MISKLKKPFIMALQFKTYVPKESTLVELGTVVSQIPGGKLDYTPGSLSKYLAGSIKSISILLTNKKGESTTLPVSKRVAATVKLAIDNGTSKKDCLIAISKLLIVETEDGSNIIVGPRGADGEETEITIAAAQKSAVTFDDLSVF